MTGTRVGALLLVLLATTSSCQKPEAPPEVSSPKSTRVLLIGIDGGEWSALERLFARGRLKNLKSIAERGVRGDLETISDKSPVIWTTIATGVPPAVHGITDFVIPTQVGNRPVASTLRRVPALWNMLSARGQTVSVFGWWATWPAEPIKGLMLSDRAFEPLPNVASPPDYEAEFLNRRTEATADDTLLLPREGVGLRDRWVAWAARERLTTLQDSGGVDRLTAVYFRSADVMSHLYWTEFEQSQDSGPTDPVTLAYAAIDQAIGELVRSAGPNVDVVVISDHGFKPLAEPQITLSFDLDQLLEQVGLLKRNQLGHPDPEHSVAFSLGARNNSSRRPVVLVGDQALARRRLVETLREVVWSGSGSAFRVVDANRNERRAGAHATVRVTVPDELRKDLEPSGLSTLSLTFPDRGAIPLSVSAHRLTGGHTKSTSGIFLAAGPTIKASPHHHTLSVRDMAPTLLYLLGLPVAEDFSGVVQADLFREAFRSQPHPTAIDSWGQREATLPPAALTDPERLEELRALGYLQ